MNFAKQAYVLLTNGILNVVSEEEVNKYQDFFSFPFSIFYMIYFLNV